MNKMQQTFTLPDTCLELQMLHIANEVLESLTDYEKERIIVWLASKHAPNYLLVRSN